jgi:hypothetical protein
MHKYVHLLNGVTDSGIHDAYSCICAQSDHLEAAGCAQEVVFQYNGKPYMLTYVYPPEPSTKQSIPPHRMLLAPVHTLMIQP